MKMFMMYLLLSLSVTFLCVSVLLLLDSVNITYLIPVAEHLDYWFIPQNSKLETNLIIMAKR